MGADEEARLNIVISAQNKAASALQGLSGSLTGLVQGFMKLGAAAAAGFAFKDMVNTTVRAADEVASLSRSLGVTAQEASQLRMAADDMQLSIDGLTMGMGQFSTKLKEVGKAGNVFDQLGIQVANANGALRPTMDVLGQVADKIKAMPDGLAKLSVVRDIFGRSGDQWLQLLNQGSEGIRSLGADAAKMGLLFDDAKIAQAREYRLAVNDLGDAFEGLKVTLGAAILPALTSVAKGFISFAQDAIPWVRRGLEAVAPVARGFWNVLVSVWTVVRQALSSFFSAATAMGVMSSGTKAASNAFQWLLTLAKDIAQHINALRPIAEPVGKVLAGAAAVAMGEWKALGHVIEGFVKAVGDLAHGDVNKALADIGAGFRSAGGDLGEIGDALAQVNPALGTFSFLLGSIAAVFVGDALVVGIGRFANALGKLGIIRTLSGFGREFVAIFRGLGALVYGAVLEIVGAVGLLPVLIGVALVGLGLLIWKNWDKIKTWTAEHWEAIKKAVGRAWDGIKEGVSAGANAVWTFITETVPHWIEGFAKWTADTLKHIGKWFLDLPSSLAEKVGFVAGWLSEKIPQWWEAFRDWLAKSLAHIGQWLLDLPGNMVKGVKTVGSWLAEHVGYWWDAFKDWLTTTLTNITTWLAELPGKLLDKIKGFGTWLAETLPAMWTGFTIWLGIVLVKFLEWLTGLPGEIGKGISGIWSALLDKGKEIGSQIWAGVKSGIGSIGDLFGGMVSSAVDWGRNIWNNAMAGFGAGKAAAKSDNKTQPGGSDAMASADLNDLAPHAAGGIFLGPTIFGKDLFGEAGPEMVMPLTPSNVAQYMGGGGAGTVNVYVTVQGSLVHERDLQRTLTQMVKDGLMKELKMQKQMAF